MSENNEIKPVGPVDQSLFLNYSVVSVKELFNKDFVNSFIKLRSVALPIHQVQALKKFGTEILITKTNELAAQQNATIEKYGTRQEDGSWKVTTENLDPEVKLEFTKENNEFWSQLIETGLSEKFLLPHSTNVLTVDDFDMIERFIRIPR
jgi:hypothetical protein